MKHIVWWSVFLCCFTIHSLSAQQITIRWLSTTPLQLGEEAEILIIPTTQSPIASITYTYNGEEIQNIGNVGVFKVLLVPNSPQDSVLRYQIQLQARLTDNTTINHSEEIAIKVEQLRIEFIQVKIPLYSNSCNLYNINYLTERKVKKLIGARGGLVYFVEGSYNQCQLIPAGGPFEVILKEVCEDDTIEHDRYRFRVLAPPCPTLAFGGLADIAHTDTIILNRSLSVSLKRDFWFQNQCSSDYYHFDSAFVSFSALNGFGSWEQWLYAAVADSNTRDNSIQTVLPPLVRRGISYLCTFRVYGNLINCAQGKSNVAFCNFYENSNAECLVFHYIAVLKD